MTHCMLYTDCRRIPPRQYILGLLRSFLLHPYLDSDGRCLNLEWSRRIFDEISEHNWTLAKPRLKEHRVGSKQPAQSRGCLAVSQISLGRVAQEFCMCPEAEYSQVATLEQAATVRYDHVLIDLAMYACSDWSIRTYTTTRQSVRAGRPNVLRDPS